MYIYFYLIYKRKKNFKLKMKKFFVLLFAISAVSFINSQEYTISVYLHYFISLLAKASDINIQCPEFLLSKEDKIVEIYYIAARKLKDGAKWNDTMTEAGLKYLEYLNLEQTVIIFL